MEKIHITIQIAEECIQRKALSYDKDGDQHYDVISALQKSIRGSDVNAALHYAARLMEAGDLTSLMRRLLVIAYEDIGLGIHKVPLAQYPLCKLRKDLVYRKLEFHLRMRLSNSPFHLNQTRLFAQSTVHCLMSEKVVRLVFRTT